MKLQNSFRFFAIKSIFFVIVFINCSYVPENIRPEVLTLDSIKNDKDVIVVGRIEMDPPFRKDDFFLKVSGLDLFSAKEFMQKVYRNKIHVHISDSDTEKKSERLRGGFDAYNKIDYSDKFIAPLSKVYYFKYTNKPLYFIDFGVLLSFFSDNRKYRNTTYKRAIFIGDDFKIDIHPDDKAVYFGTIQFQRFAYPQTYEPKKYGKMFINFISKETRKKYFKKRFKIMDDFIEVRKEFIKKFGRKYTLRKSLAVPVQLKPKD